MPPSAPTPPPVPGSPGAAPPSKGASARPSPPVPEESLEATRVFVDGVGREMSQTWGKVSGLAGRIFAALYLCGRPMDMEELSRLLGRSKSNISVNVRALIELGLVERAWTPGSRRERYVVGPDYGDVILRAFFRRLGDNLEANGRAVRSAVELLERIEPRSPEDRERLARMRARAGTALAFYDAARRLYGGFSRSIGFELDFLGLVRRVAGLLTARDPAPHENEEAR